jgi:hypothetical protein
VPNLANTVTVGKADGGFRVAYLRDASGTYLRCHILSGPVDGPFTIFVPSLKPAGVAVARKTLVPPATSKSNVYAVHPSPRVM